MQLLDCVLLNMNLKWDTTDVKLDAKEVNNKFWFPQKY